jgi:peptidyl-prolyl cis-trans isomerase SurA
MSLAMLSGAMAGCHPTQSADVVATVNGHPILRSELDKRYDDEVGEQSEKPPAEQADATRLGLLDNQLILEEVLLQRAAKMNVTATPEEVDDKLKEMKAPYTEEQFNQRLGERHLTVDDLKREVLRNLTINKLLHKEIDAKITVSDSDIASYFALHKSEFNNVNTLYHLAQIVVTTAPNPRPGNLQGSKATTEAEARKKIQALRTRWESGEDFGSLAMNFSENPKTSPNGGDMGIIPEPELQQDPQVFGAISKLKPGQVTDIIPFPDAQDPKKLGGFAIFQLISMDPAGQHDISEPQVQQRIRQGLHDNRSQLLKGAYYEMLRDQAKVENFFAEQIFKSDAH